MKYGLRILALIAVVVIGALASGLTQAQGDIRVTPLTSPIALWCTGDGNKTIMAYRFDQDGTSHFAWRYTPGVTVPGATAESTAPASAAFADRLVSATPEATAAASSNHGNGALIDQEGVGLYLNPDGRYSALTTQWDGKQFVFFFEGCPNAGLTNAYVINADGSWVPVNPG